VIDPINLLYTEYINCALLICVPISICIFHYYLPTYYRSRKTDAQPVQDLIHGMEGIIISCVTAI